VNSQPLLLDAKFEVFFFGLERRCKAPKLEDSRNNYQWCK